MIGAFARIFGKPSLEDIIAAIQEDVPGEVERNVRAAKEAYQSVKW
jgi:Pyruvate/2-oxoacid:ferredoxin oxidoreductase gamma subunit